MSELTPKEAVDVLNQTISVRNAILDNLSTEGISENVSHLAIVSLAESMRSHLSEEDRTRLDLAARSFNALTSLTETVHSIESAGEN